MLPDTCNVKTVQQVAAALKVVMHCHFRSKQLIRCLIKKKRNNNVNIPISLKIRFFGNAMARHSTFVLSCYSPINLNLLHIYEANSSNTHTQFVFYVRLWQTTRGQSLEQVWRKYTESVPPPNVIVCHSHYKTVLFTA